MGSLDVFLHGMNVLEGVIRRARVRTTGWGR